MCVCVLPLALEPPWVYNYVCVRAASIRAQLWLSGWLCVRSLWASRPQCMQSVRTCACKREHRIKCSRDAHIYTFALSHDCGRSRWQRRDDYDDDWRPNLKTTNHTCRGRSVLQKRLIAVQGRPSSTPIRLRKMYVGVLIRERKKRAHKATVVVLWDETGIEACRSVTFDVRCLTSPTARSR